jgi:hypothetical protein
MLKVENRGGTPNIARQQKILVGQSCRFAHFKQFSQKPTKRTKNFLIFVPFCSKFSGLKIGRSGSSALPLMAEIYFAF